MKKSLLISFLFFTCFYYAQKNCNIYKLNNTSRYLACLKCEAANVYYQFSKEFQEIHDEAIQIDSNYVYPYVGKSVAYLKSGDFLTWKKLIDKAVQLNPKEYLGYRASCRFQFFHDYTGCIKDIEKLNYLIDYDLGEIHNGDYHLNTIKAISYDAIGQTEKAIGTLNTHMNSKDYFPLIYDHLLMGIFYLKGEKYNQAIVYFNQQKKLNNIAENEYYLGIAYKHLNKVELAQEAMNSSFTLYTKLNRMNDPYSMPYGKIYLMEIKQEIEVLSKLKK